MSNTQPFSPTQWSANTVADYLRTNQDEGYAMQGAKLGAGFLANSAVTILGALETLTVATITAIAYPILWAFSPTTLEPLTNRISIAFNATLDAACGIVGSYPEAKNNKYEDPKKGLIDFVFKQHEEILEENEKLSEKNKQLLNKINMLKEQVKTEQGKHFYQRGLNPFAKAN